LSSDLAPTAVASKFESEVQELNREVQEENSKIGKKYKRTSSSKVKKQK